MSKKSLTYAQTGDNYDTKDPVKISAQVAAASTSKYLVASGFPEISATRGESAFVWKQGKVLMASVIEGLGTKNLIADSMYELTGKPYYDDIARDTVATIINDLITVGAKPLVLHAYWAIENNDWLSDTKRLNDLISGWKKACDKAHVTWGGGETPTLKGIMRPNLIELGGSAIGIIENPKHLIADKKLRVGDRIILLKSSGINANGSSLCRAIAKRLKSGYLTMLPDGKSFGEHLLRPANIYADLVQKLLTSGVDIHYISNITGHGLRKIMRARQDFSYVIDEISTPLPVFSFMQTAASLSDYEMYQTFNMGMDYALFVPEKDVKRTQEIIKGCKFSSINAGSVQKGKRQVVINPINITFSADSMSLRR